MIQQVGHDGEEHRLEPRLQVVVHRRRQVGLAAAVATYQHQPALGLLGEGHSGVVGRRRPLHPREVLKGALL